MEEKFQKTELQLMTESIKRLLIWGYESYEASFQAGAMMEARYWDGYIRALHHVLEAEGQ